jgi:hypothetical protein
MDGGNRCAWAARVVAAFAAAGALMARAPAATEGSPAPAAVAGSWSIGWRPVAHVEPPNDAAWSIGPAVALCSGTLAVGPARDWDLGEDRGGVRLHRLSGGRWLEDGAILHPSADIHANFGASLALTDMHLAIGSPRDASAGFEAGALHLFRRHAAGWIAEAVLTRPEPSTSDLLGTSVALHGETVVIGAPKADVGALDTGCAEVFRHAEGAWIHEATLVAPDPQIGALFGLSVAVDGDTIMVGAPGDGAQGPATGRVHVFTRSHHGWRWDGSIGCPAGARSWFGASVAGSRGLWIAGAPRATRPDPVGFIRGAAWRIERIGGRWQTTRILLPGDATSGDALGCAAATDGTTVVLGATADGLRGDLAGCAFAFRMDALGWSCQRLDPPVSQPDSLIGHGVTVDADWIAVGRLGNPEETPGPGRVDLFQATRRALDLSGPSGQRPRAVRARIDQVGPGP